MKNFACHWACRWPCVAVACAVFAPALLVVSMGASAEHGAERGAGLPALTEKEDAVVVRYLEIVTPNVDETCRLLGALHGVSFGDPVPEFGNARTAELAGGGRIGVRWPLRESETPVVRPYVLVEDIEAAVEEAEALGAEIAMPPTPLNGEVSFAIYILGGIEHGLWAE